MKTLFPLLMILCSCTAPAWAPLHQGSLFRTDFHPTFKGPAAGSSATNSASSNSASTPTRDIMVKEARALLQQDTPVLSWGTEDVQRITAAAIADTPWPADASLEKFVASAQKCGAYQTQHTPEAGDIILFHNQRDLNDNGISDDWFTGCGVVTDARGNHLEIVSRTGHAPRHIALWISGPSVHTHNGQVVNGFARVPTRSDPEDAEYLSRQLYAGFIDVEILAQRCKIGKK